MDEGKGMQQFSLRHQKGHLFIHIDGDDWLLDTGAPTSFGTNCVAIGGQKFSIPRSYMGLDAEELSGFVKCPTSGIIGADVLNGFDILIDIRQGLVLFSAEEISLEGEAIEMTDFMGIPVIQANIGGSDRKMFFDTGAQISYLQDDSLVNFPSNGVVSDFYPGFGEFETETYRVDTMLGTTKFELICGSLPGMLGMTLGIAGVEGIIGNEILMERTLGYFPRQRFLVLS
jgi:hypothetical protein